HRCRLKWLPGRRRTGSEIAAVSVQPFFLSLGWCFACRARSLRLPHFASSV
ncbi:hypothetical protein S245_048562, partial [Arachis hypogaea]